MKKPLNIQIGARVRIARERLHMSRETLAELVDISTLFLGFIECGQKGMSMETLITICETLHVSADYILLGRESGAAHVTKAERLLHDLPEAYLPLAEETLLALIRTIAAVQSRERKRARTAQQDAAKTAGVQIAARSGDHVEMTLPAQKAAALDSELSRLKEQPSDFTD